ncbi:MAG: chromate resistance protein ChrB domain-containing protein, partial [Pseudomonadota bacterium]
MKKKTVILILILFSFAVNAFSATFSTWEGFEADKLASIWLIKRFVSLDAKIVFYPKGQVMDDGIQFDTPYSKIKRRFNQSTFESLLEHYNLTDLKLQSMAKLIHDVEINVW